MARNVMKIISPSLSPNTEADDVLLTVRTIFSPWEWIRGTATGKVEAWFRQYLDTSCAVSFNSGRSALLGLLRSFGIHKGDEVILQAFTCVAVPNSVIWAGATPIYADIDETFNLDPKDFEKKITGKTKAIIVQHTFGIPANMEAIFSIARKYNLIVIEDCAHSLGSVYKGKKIGTFGDCAFFSFGRDKIVSSVFGGMATIRNGHTKQITALKAFHKKLTTPSFGWIIRQILHPLAFAVILPLYRLGIGKVILVVLQRLTLLSFPVYEEEKTGHQPKDFPAKYPNALAILILHQLKKLDRYTNERKEIVRFYGREGSWLRFPVQVDDPESLIQRAKKSGILLGNWYHNTIDPKGVNYASIGYTSGSCPHAEYAAKHIINLPTRIPLSDAKRVKALL